MTGYHDAALDTADAQVLLPGSDQGLHLGHRPAHMSNPWKSDVDGPTSLRKAKDPDAAALAEMVVLAPEIGLQLYLVGLHVFQRSDHVGTG